VSDPGDYLWLIPVLPLAAAVLTAFLGPTLLRRQSHWPCILASVASCVLSLAALSAVGGLEKGETFRRYYTWFQAGNVDVGFTLRLDALTAVMLVTVTFVGSLIVIYSVGYMSHEREHNEGYARFFAEMALFIFSMTGLVLADNFLVLYAFWEGVGLCSYLLIGFWFTKPSAAAAARKAFLVTRIGDVGFILGIIVLWMTFGYRLDYDTVFSLAPDWAGTSTLAVICLLIFCGAVGKSAQFPLHVWLPDAMEGPTPVSALIHAATMVTAGVYLVGRCMPLFAAAPAFVLMVVAAIGAFTALLAALMALTQTDLKRVLAYSTISQLGYMFLALGSGVVTAAIFHLFTHAFFKALLFLAAGSVMHAMGNVIDLRRFGGLRHVLPTTHWTFLAGALALAGIVPFAGFWSKDEILVAAWQAHGALYSILFISAVVTAGLTAFYTFRAYFLTFHGPERIPPEAGGHAHESPPVMTGPLTVLAVGALVVGLVNAEPLTHALAGFLGRTRYFAAHEAEYGMANLLIGLVSTAVAFAGIGLAWWVYVREPGVAGRWAQGLQALYQASLNRFYIDELYEFFIVGPVAGFAEFCRLFDQYVVDGVVDLVGIVPRLGGVLLRPVQNGLVQFYGLALMLGLTMFLAVLAWRLVAAFAG
jgi:proton-translocating NADH-quinone oxidoreductase chain L